MLLQEDTQGIDTALEFRLERPKRHTRRRAAEVVCVRKFCWEASTSESSVKCITSTHKEERHKGIEKGEHNSQKPKTTWIY